MLLQYSCETHTRKHGPAGYINYQTFKPWLRDEFEFRCVYCLIRERWLVGHDSFGVDHAKPKTDFPELECCYDNLLYACNRCNTAKGVHLLCDPTLEGLGKHLAVTATGEIRDTTDMGKLLIAILALDSPQLTEKRRTYITIARLRETRPDDEDVIALYLDAFGYPQDMPDLRPLRPKSNSRPLGCGNCFLCTVAPSDLYK